MPLALDRIATPRLAYARTPDPGPPLMIDTITSSHRNTQNPQRVDFGTITDYVAPKDRFPGSIMNLSNTGASSLPAPDWMDLCSRTAPPKKLCIWRRALLARGGFNGPPTRCVSF
jgi:hypothetical protein